ncbi:ComZ family protein [Bacillus timonensis]|nr:ComZ family protein [Bacillus timonensis]
MDHPKSMQFMQIAMKYFPEAKSVFDEAGIELSLEKMQPMLGLFTKVMAEAYELGKEEALQNENE